MIQNPPVDETGLTTERQRVAVEAECGHRWVEHRPAGLYPPKDGERRVCGSQSCYPEWFPVRYSEPPDDWQTWVQEGRRSV